MNTNEVIANQHWNTWGRKKGGSYDVINQMTTSTCRSRPLDAYPTGRLSSYFINKVTERIDAPQDSEVKGNEFQDILKMGHTQLQDAVPMTP